MIIAKLTSVSYNKTLRKKIINSMKLISPILLIFIMQLSVQAKSQNKITHRFKNVELTKAIAILESESTYRFVYNNNLVPDSKKVVANFYEADIPEVMDVMLKGTGLSYKML
ncbi:MAG: STN domain-containing protein, partial [Ferruginibacter sp.]